MPTDQTDTAPGMKARRPRDIVRRGGGAGLSGAIVMALVMMLVSVAQGTEPFRPLRLVAAAVLGEAALFEASAIPLGALIHLSAGIALGLAFAALLRQQVSAAFEIGLALIYAALLAVLVTYVVLPVINPIMYLRLDHGWFFVAHLAYGATLGFVSTTVGQRIRLREPKHA